MRELEKIIYEIETEKKKHWDPNDDGDKIIGWCFDKCINIVLRHLEAIGTGVPESGIWTPTQKQMPENANRKGEFCPKYLVTTKYGVTEGWYRPDDESWHILVWFAEEGYLEHKIDLERGDVPKIGICPAEYNIVTAWQPFPDPYRPERSKE